jgi:hypothetical protein
MMSSTPSTQDAPTVLAGVKGSVAALGGCAALDAVCARCVLAFVDGVSFKTRLVA